MSSHQYTRRQSSSLVFTSGQTCVLVRAASLGLTLASGSQALVTTRSRMGHASTATTRRACYLNVTCIDQGRHRRTEIGAGTRIDNLVHIAHNVIIGKRCLIIAHTMLGGSVTIGDDAHIAPGSLIRDWRNVGPNATSGLGAVVITDIPDGETHAGNPARNLEVPNDRQRNRLGRTLP